MAGRALTVRTVQKTVAANGTAETLVAAETLAYGVKIKALLSNTNNVYIGNNGSGDVASGTGWELDAGQEITIGELAARGGGQDKIDLFEIWIDADTNGEGVSIMYYVAEGT